MLFLFGRTKKKEEVDFKPQPFEEKITIGKLSLPQMAKQESRTAEDISLIIKEWLDEKHVKRKTRLNKRQVRAVTTFQGLAIEWDIIVIENFLIWFLSYKLSEDGQSSKELENILKARMPEIQEDNAMNKLSRFLE